MSNSRSGGAATISQASAFVFGAVVTAFAGGGFRLRSLPCRRRLGVLTSSPCCRACFPGLWPRRREHSRVPCGRTPGPMWQDWVTVVCFSCGKVGHGATRCPDLNEAFRFMLPGWKAKKVGGGYVMISPRVAAERRRPGNGD